MVLVIWGFRRYKKQEVFTSWRNKPMEMVYVTDTWSCRMIMMDSIRSIRHKQTQTNVSAAVKRNRTYRSMPEMCDRRTQKTKDKITADQKKDAHSLNWKWSVRNTGLLWRLCLKRDRLETGKGWDLLGEEAKSSYS